MFSFKLEIVESPTTEHEKELILWLNHVLCVCV